MLPDFTSIDDIVAGIILALDHPPLDDGKLKPGGFSTPHHLYNIGNNSPEPLMDLIGAIEKHVAAKRRSIYSNAGRQSVPDLRRYRASA